jgi:hypothetical protein
VSAVEPPKSFARAFASRSPIVVIGTCADGKSEIWKLRSAEIAGLGDFSRELVPGQMGVRKIPEEGRDFAE